MLAIIEEHTARNENEFGEEIAVRQQGYVHAHGIGGHGARGHRGGGHGEGDHGDGGGAIMNHHNNNKDKYRMRHANGCTTKYYVGFFHLAFLFLNLVNFFYF